MAPRARSGQGTARPADHRAAPVAARDRRVRRTVPAGPPSSYRPGTPRPGEGAFTGRPTLASLAPPRFDTATPGCCGLTAGQGLTAYDLDVAVEQAAIQAVRCSTVVADGAEPSRTAHAFVAPDAALGSLVTDVTAPRAESAALGAAGVPPRTGRPAELPPRTTKLM
ncbi:hypothetical protein ACWEKM_26305 [Streptomyces sp. NPDC004752]